MLFGIVSIAVGVLAILDAIFHIFRTTVQGRPASKLLRYLEAAIGVGFIILGIWLLNNRA